MQAFDQLPILLVEDSDDDLFFFRRLFSKARIDAPLTVVTDGHKAMRHFEAALKASAPGKASLPRIVFLDLKLPLRSGFDVLQWIRGHPALKQVVVVVLSSSAEARDIAQAFDFGAQAYLVKYPEPAVFADLVRQVAEAPSGVDLKNLKLPGLERPGA